MFFQVKDYIRNQASDPGPQSHGSFLSKFQPAETSAAEPSTPQSSHSAKAPLFSGSLNFQPFRKDPAKQERYDKYLALIKQGVNG